MAKECASRQADEGGGKSSNGTSWVVGHSSEDDIDRVKKLRPPLSVQAAVSRRRYALVGLTGLFLYWLFGGSLKGRASNNQAGEADEDGGGMGSVELIQADAKFGWDVNIGPLVSKLRPRECKLKRIDPQVFAPVTYKSKKIKGWMRRAFACARKSGKCRAALVDDLEDRRWKKISKGLDATVILTDHATLQMLQARDQVRFEKLYHEREGMTYLDTILGSAAALDGNRVEQFVNRARYTAQFGCSLNQLKVLAPAYELTNARSCQQFQSRVAAETGSKHSRWVIHQWDSASRQLSTKATDSSGAEAAAGVPSCDASARLPETTSVLAVRVMENPLLYHKKAFTVRSFMLIGSTLPHMVFFRRGFLRRTGDGTSASGTAAAASSTPASSPQGQGTESLAKFQEHLAFSKTAGSHYVDTHLQAAMKQIAQFVFQAARRDMRRRRGSFQVIAIDYVVDEAFRVFLDQTVGYPDLVQSDGIGFDTAGMVAEMHDLVTELQEVPVAFESMVPGDKYGEWEMIFSELHESCTRIAYNPCHAFFGNNDDDLRSANSKIGRVHNTETRYRHAVVDRIKKKTEEAKKARCKEKHLSYPSARCDRLYQEEDQANFVQHFAAHERSYNPNDFGFSKPGTLFPWEEV